MLDRSLTLLRQSHRRSPPPLLSRLQQLILTQDSIPLDWFVHFVPSIKQRRCALQKLRWRIGGSSYVIAGLVKPVKGVAGAVRRVAEERISITCRIRDIQW